MQLSNGESDKQQVVVQKKKRSAWSTISMIFLLLFAIAAGTAVWFWYMWQNDHLSLNDAKSNVSASEQTIANLRNELGKANQTIKDTTEQGAGMSDEDMIKAAATDHNDLLAVPVQNPTITVTKKDGDQAIASVGTPVTGVGYVAYCKKVDGKWFVIWSGQNTPPADVVTQYGIKIQ